MFKLIKRKVWKELVYKLESEITELECKLEVYEERIKEDIPRKMDGELDQARVYVKEKYIKEIPDLKLQLENKKQQLKKLK